VIYDELGTLIVGMWDKTEHLVSARREDPPSPRYLENFELLQMKYRRWALLPAALFADDSAGLRGDVTAAFRGDATAG
jgi:hypothetical protein